jgi:hypothetical protein
MNEIRTRIQVGPDQLITGLAPRMLLPESTCHYHYIGTADTGEAVPRRRPASS